MRRSTNPGGNLARNVLLELASLSQKGALHLGVCSGFVLPNANLYDERWLVSESKGRTLVSAYLWFTCVIRDWGRHLHTVRILSPALLPVTMCNSAPIGLTHALGGVCDGKKKSENIAVVAVIHATNVLTATHSLHANASSDLLRVLLASHSVQ